MSNILQKFSHARKKPPSNLAREHFSPVTPAQRWKAPGQSAAVAARVTFKTRYYPEVGSSIMVLKKRTSMKVVSTQRFYVTCILL